MCHLALHLQHQAGQLPLCLLPLSNPESLIQRSHSFLDQVNQLHLLQASLQLTQHSPGLPAQTGSLLLLLMGMPWEQGISVIKQHTMDLQHQASKQWFQLPV